MMTSELNHIVKPTPKESKEVNRKQQLVEKLEQSGGEWAA
jgi:hypothetical protein